MDPVPAVIGVGVALVLLVAALLLRGPEGRSTPARILAALAPVAGVAATYYVLGYTLEVWPSTFHGKVMNVAVIAALLGCVTGAGGLGDVLRVVGVAGLGFALFRYGTEVLHDGAWSGQVALHVAAFAGAAVLLQIGRAVADRGDRTTEVTLATAIAALPAAPVIGWSGSGLSALMVAALSSSAGNFGLLLAARTGFRTTAAPLGRAMSPSQSLLLVGLCANGLLFSEARLPVTAMVVFSPLVVLLPGGGMRWAIARLVVVAALAGSAVGLEKAHQDAKPADPYADAYGGY